MVLAETSRAVNTTGVGGVFLAGFLIVASPAGAERDPTSNRPRVDVRAGLALRVSWGAHAVSFPTTFLEPLEDAPTAQVSLPDLAAFLSKPTRIVSAPHGASGAQRSR